MQFAPEMLQTLNSTSVISGVCFWVFSAVMLFLIGKKTSTTLPWLAFIPIVQYAQAVRIARKPLSWFAVMLLAPILAVILAYIPPFDPTGGILLEGITSIHGWAILVLAVLPLALYILVCTEIAVQRGKSRIWGALAGIPFTSPIGLGYLGLSK